MLMQEARSVVRGFIEDVINQGNIDAADQYFWEDMVEQVPFPGQGPGIEGLKDVLRMMRSAFPDMHWTVEEQIAEGDRVMTRFEWTGTHQGNFLGVPATGRAVKTWGMVIDHLEEGRIKDTRILMDALGLMMQLGAVGSPG
ncbi:Ester cyclase [Pararobbsia alpina]|uniref:ester cyclase n=1 Tax=Pararobbsia alpina TaxID=621374 RepID=UPI0039A61ECB